MLQSRVSRTEHEKNPRLDRLQSYGRALGLELILVPRKQLSRVRAALSDERETTDDGEGRSRFLSLADLMRQASDETDKQTRRRGSSP